jgi:putative ABC transport system permease protein
MSTFFTIALRNLIQAKRRTLFLSLALFMISMLLVLLMALSEGVSQTMLRSATILVAGHVNVGGFYKPKVDMGYPIVTDVSKVKQIINETVEGLDYIVDRGRGWGKLISASSSFNTGITGIDVNSEKKLIQQLRLAPQSDYKEQGETRVLGNIKHLSQPNTVLIYHGQAKRLEVDVGDTLTLTSETVTGAVNTLDVKIVAIAKDVGLFSNWNIFAEKSVIKQLYRLGDDISGVIQIHLKQPDQAPLVMEKLRETFIQQGYQLMDHQADPFWKKFELIGGEDWVNQKLDLTLWEDEISYMKWALAALDGLSYFLISILLVIIIIGIINTMWMSVRERTQEIGSLRAIGMQSYQVLWLFMLEALLLGFIATTLGSFSGATMAWIVNFAQISLPSDAMKSILMSETLTLSVNLTQISQAIFTFTSVTMIAALWPAYKASRMQPVSAIHYTG